MLTFSINFFEGSSPTIRREASLSAPNVYHLVQNQVGSVLCFYFELEVFGII